MSAMPPSHSETEPLHAHPICRKVPQKTKMAINTVGAHWDLPFRHKIPLQKFPQRAPCNLGPFGDPPGFLGRCHLWCMAGNPRNLATRYTQPDKGLSSSQGPIFLLCYLCNDPLSCSQGLQETFSALCIVSLQASIPTMICPSSHFKEGLSKTFFIVQSSFIRASQGKASEVLLFTVQSSRRGTRNHQICTPHVLA